MIAYKITGKNMQCHGYQYVPGTIHKFDGEIEICKSGFHAARNPVDAMRYHDLYESRFFVVDCRGKIVEQEDRLVCSEMEILWELTLDEWIDSCYQFFHSRDGCKDVDTSSWDYQFQASSDDFSKQFASMKFSGQASAGICSSQVSSGDYSRQASSGNCSCQVSYGDVSSQAASGDLSRQASSGDYSSQSASGESSSQASSGDSCKQSSSGDYSSQTASGYSSRQSSSGDSSIHVSYGDSSRQASSGDRNRHELHGENSVAAALGVRGKVKVCNESSWIMLVNWRSDGSIENAIAVKPGQDIGQVTIKAGYWYWFKDGKLMEEEGE